jgi:hypothetical protein
MKLLSQNGNHNIKFHRHQNMCSLTSLVKALGQLRLNPQISALWICTATHGTLKHPKHYLLRPNKDIFASCFRPSLNKLAVPKIFIEHLKKEVFILVLGDENCMKIGQQMTEIWTKITLKIRP